MKEILTKEEIKEIIEALFTQISDWNGEDIHISYFITLPNATEEDPQSYKLERITAKAEEGDTLEDVKKAVTDYMLGLEEYIYCIWGGIDYDKEDK